MGEVYKARDTRLDRTVAIKILSKALAADPQFRDRFDRGDLAGWELDRVSLRVQPCDGPNRRLSRARSREDKARADFGQRRRDAALLEWFNCGTTAAAWMGCRQSRPRRTQVSRGRIQQILD